MKPSYSSLKKLKIAPFSLLLLLSFQLNAIAQTSWQIGNGTASNSSTGYPAVYGQWYSGDHEQFLYTATEMTAAGMTAGSIDQIAFNVTALNSMQALQSFNMYIKGTTTPNTNSFQTTGLTLIYSSPSELPVVGWNTYTLATPFNWNGTDNILIDVCFWNGQVNYTHNASTQWTTNAVPGVNTSIYYYSDYNGPFCGTTSYNGTSTTRPNIKFTRLLGAPTNFAANPTTVCSGSQLTLSADGLANGATANWSGPGIAPNTSTPEVNGSASYTFAAPNVAATTIATYSVTQTSGATTSQSSTVDVTIEPTPVFSANYPNSNSPVCEGSTLTFHGQTSPAAATYSWTGPALQNPATSATVNVANISPSGAGTYTVTASTAAGCSVTTTLNVTVNPKPNVTLDSLPPACSADSIFALSGGLPAGGTYIGTGVANNMYDPLQGTHTVSYVYTNGSGCSDTASQLQVISPSPLPVISELPQLCSNSQPYTLFGGVPQGGTFSGPGVVNGVFTQTGAGTYPITYTYINNIGCAGYTTQDLVVSAAGNTGLAGDVNNIESQFLIDVPATTEVRYPADCDLMTILDPSGANPIGGNTTVKVILDPSVMSFGSPYLQRHYSITSPSNPTTATGTVTLYATQAEFNAYNTAAAAQGLPLLPTGGVDNGNVRVTVYQSLWTIPDPNVPAITITPTVTWDAAHGWWKMVVPVTQIGGFYIHTGDISLAVTNVSSNSGDMSVFPNPARDKVNVQVAGTINGDAQLQLSDLAGRTLISVPMDNSKAVMDISSLASGMYMLTYSDERRKETIKITKQ